ncbi:SHOCT domain-containing protein [Ferruginivarius sediminum]|uniref:SHOCT domain-containing protein n=2 Tax=Ferruginivarius sediminum TaxID=2661937 RepID=A0A369TA30_9PROT|nr:SHOCT domain-containing protein [Ferruginivarius sediminum]
MPWYGMVLGPLMMVLVLTTVIVVAVIIVRWLGGSFPDGGPDQARSAAKAPLRILEERYARGEIDKEEFEERRRTLGY